MSINVYNELEHIKLLLSKKSFEEAYILVTSFIEKYGALSEAVFVKAKISRRLRKFDESLELFKSLEKVSEYKLESYWGQSLIYTALKNEEDRKKCYEKIVHFSTNIPLVKESRKLLKEIFDKNLTSSTLLLTTFPKHASNNVGDQLISFSTIELIQSKIPDFNPIIEFRATNLDSYENSIVKNIIAPGFSICNRTYPELYGLYSDIEKLPYFFPIGCSFQHIEPSFEAFDKYSYEKETLEFLKSITMKPGPLPCRDQLIVDMLTRFDIPAFYSGDMAIYDEKYINSKFLPPKNINSIVFTVGHHEKYYSQAFDILKMILNIFPKAKLYIAFHSKVSPKLKEISELAYSLGYTELHLYGDVKNLKIYDEIDLHVGYRLHGHISFLRRRKPSVLLVEDARSFGFAKTEGTRLGCFDVYNVKQNIIIENLQNEIYSFINRQIKEEFQDYNKVFSFIDHTYNNVVDKYFINLVKML